MNRTSSILGGIGAIAFGVLTFVGYLVADWPGGPYNEATARNYASGDHLPLALIGTSVGLLAVAGLVCLLAHLQRRSEASASNGSPVPQIVWGIGLASAAAFAVGWGLVSAQPLAHAEAGVDIPVANTLTYMISEATSAIIFGPAAMLAGIALIIFSTGSGGRVLPAWLWWSTLVTGLIAIAHSHSFRSSFS